MERHCWFLQLICCLCRWFLAVKWQSVEVWGDEENCDVTTESQAEFHCGNVSSVSSSLPVPSFCWNSPSWTLTSQRKAPCITSASCASDGPRDRSDHTIWWRKAENEELDDGAWQNQCAEPVTSPRVSGNPWGRTAAQAQSHECVNHAAVILMVTTAMQWQGPGHMPLHSCRRENASFILLLATVEVNRGTVGLYRQ